MVINKRKERSNKNAQLTCRALRAVIGKAQNEVTKEDWDIVTKYLFRWMKNTGKICYVQPK